ncbi:hemagglutinin repeat-containing protein [Marinospirillum sp.]|uniref:two-partner secretion domain-containing protein n=1 Tax=Marinospirillum sp. TaxID=2183934 RepID=UPI0028707342|nr:hemagglutinin repeat-containing protein [Marinospirillum sp.]MDR9468499.1 hemagglutinin repeat-containing protein [Marinospirillum sp.]
MGNLKLNEIYLALIKSKNEKKQIGISQQIKVVTAWTLLVTYPLHPGLLLAEGIVGSTKGQYSPEVLESNSGVPTVNINKPSNQGVSRNEYDDFNVGPEGAILNNSSEIIKSQLAGYIDGNNRLEGKSADIILNEVKGNDLSRLNGYIEVAGKSAETIIANPSGITCDGCGFINTPRSVLTTGTSIFDPQGDLLGYQVEKGSINFKGKGINAENLDQLDILSRAVKINADIWANNLNIITGKNKINHSDLKATPINSENDGNGVSLDVAAIGGMYANRIKIIGTEKGFGVNSEGQLLARQNFKLTSEGDIHLEGTTASLQGNVQLESKNILSNEGVVKGQNVSLKAHEIQNKTNESFLITEDVLDLNSEKLNNQGNFQADFLLSNSMDFKNSGLISVDSTNLFSQSFGNSGDVFSSDLLIESQYFSNDGKISAGQLKIGSYQIDNNDEILAEIIDFKSNDFFNSGKLISLSQININSDAVTNSGQVNAPSIKIDFEAGENLNSGSILAKNNINIKSEVGFDNAGEIESSSIVFSDGFLSNSGGIFANSIDIQNDRFSNNTSESIVLANDSLSAVSATSFNNDGLIKSKNITAKSLDIQTGSDGNWVSVEGEIDVEAQSISNHGGFSGPLINLSANKIINSGVYLGDILTVSADDLQNKSGGFQAKNNFHLNLSRKLVNDSVLFGDNFYVETNSLINNGRIEGNDVDLQSKYFENTVAESIVAAKNTLSIQSESLTNSGNFQGKGVEFDVEAISNNKEGVLFAGEDGLLVNSDSLTNFGRVQGHKIILNSQSINNGSDALILANHTDLLVQSDQLINSGLMQGNSTNITASNFKNNGSHSLLASETDLDVQVTNGDFENYGTVQSESLKLNAENLFNKSSGQFLVLSGQGEFVLQDQLINNGKIYSNDLLIDTNDFIQEGTNAWALAEDNFTLKSSNHINLATKLQAGGDFYLQAKSLTSNKKGQLLSGGYLDVNLTNNLNNYGLVQGKSASISANALTNQSSGQLATWGGRLAIDTTGSVTNKGTLTGHSLLLESRSLNNTSTLEANNHLEIDTDYQVTNSDVISGASVEIAASRLDIQNADSALLAENQMHLNIQGNINNQGTLLGGRVYANAHDFNNTTANSLMAGLDYLQLDATGDIKNTQGAEIFSLGSLSLSADQLLNESSTIEAGWDLAVDVDQLTNRKRAFATEERTTTTEVDSHSIDPYGKYISGTRSYTETETTRVVTENSPSAYLLSGRNLSIQGDVDNLYSVVSAGGSLSHNGGSLNNQSAVASRVVTRSGEDRMKRKERYCSFDTWFGCADHSTRIKTDTLAYNTTDIDNLSLSSATFSANKNLTGRVDEVNNVSRDLTNVEDQNLLPAPNTRQAQGQADPVELNAPTEGLAIKSGSDVSWMPSDWEQKEAGFELPSTPLITVSETPDHHYLVETSPHLTNYKEFISSDYMVQRLEHNPAKTTKRLGDGFVEQRLIRDQILEQTGVQYLGDFTSQEDQYRQLMENAIKEVDRLELTPGIALTDRQIEELQKPLVWMVEETFTTENGPETALVPRVYLGHSDDIQLRPDGSLIAAQNVHLEVDGDFQNQGSLLASEDLGIRTRDLTNTGEIQAGGNLFLETEKDLTNRDGRIKGDQVGLAVGENLINETQSTQLDYKNAEGELTGSQSFMAPTAEISGNNLAIEVGQDLTALGSRFDAAKNMSIQVDGQMELGTTQSLNQRLNRTLREVDATHQVTELNAGEQLQLSAGESLESQAAQIKAGTDMLIQAKDITLTAAKNVSENFSYMDKGTSGKITTEIMQETVLGNLIQAGGNLVASSLGGDLVSTASEFLAKKGTLALQAKKDIQLKAAQQKAEEYTQKQTKSSGFFNKTTRTRTTQIQSSTAIGNSLSGGRVEVSAGQDLEITASEVVSGHGTSLMAGGNLTLEAGENKVTTSSDYQKKRSGVFSNGGLSITAGKQKTDTTSTTTQTQAQQSVVGSLKGDVNLQAGKKYQQVGSQVTALEGDINAQAEDISITEFQETFESEQQTKFKQSGLTVSLSSPVIDAYESAKQTYEAGETAKSDRMKALAAGAGLLGLGNNASDTVQAGKATATGDVANMGLNLTATVGSTKSSSESQQSAITARGSQLSAGKNINLVATGGGESSNILIQGSQVKSGENTTLVADHSIDLLAAQNTSQQTSDN